MNLIKKILKKNRIVPAVYYRKCSELPLSVFLKVMLTSDVTHLTISGKPTIEELEEAYQIIHEEYLTLSESLEYQQMISLIKEIAINENKYNMIIMAVRVLRVVYDEKIASEIKSYGYNLSHKDVSETAYQKQLDVILSKSKFINLSLQKANDDLQKLKKKGIESGEEKPDEHAYDVLLADLSKYQGYYLDPDKITVTHFLSVMKRYKQSIENLKQKQNHV